MSDLSLPSAPPSGGKDILEIFLAGRNERTRRGYRNDLEQFRIFTGTGTTADVIAQLLSNGQGAANATILRFRAHLIDKGLAAASINRALASIRSVVKLARMLGVVAWALDIPNVPDEPYRDTRGPGVAGVKQLLATTANADDPITIRDRAILRLLYDLGLRRAEVAALDLADLDLRRSTISVTAKRRTGKTLLTLAPATVAAITAWLTVRGSDPGALFTNFDHAAKGNRLTETSIYRIVRKRGSEVGIKTSPHGLRHTAITEACKAAQAAGMPLEEVLDFSRHKNVNVLMIYRDRDRNTQGQIAALVAQTASANDTNETAE